MNKLSLSFSQRILLSVVKLYQRISTLFFTPLGISSVCRFHPTCSYYMYEAITRYGTIAGFQKGMARIFRCHPLSSGGFDPVR